MTTDPPEPEPDASMLPTDHPLTVAAITAIRAGDVPALRGMLAEHPELATARIGDDGPAGISRTLLHVVADWPGHLPAGAAAVAALVAAGADVDARFRGPHEETPLHWAASCDDLDVLDALLDAGAAIDAPGGVIGGGSPLADARAFAQWSAAHRLVERGAHVTLDDAATLGLLDRVAALAATGPSADEISRAFWGACHGGQQECARYLLERGADIDWMPPWEPLTPLDAAQRQEATDLVAWLRARGARSAAGPDGAGTR